MSSVLFIVIHYLGHCSERTRMFAEFSLTKGHLNTVVFKNSVMFQIASVSRCIGFGAVIVIIGLKVVSYLTER